MTRGRIALAILTVALALFAGLAAMRRTSPGDVPTHTVSRGRFLNEVVAYGRLHAVHSTVVTVPARIRRPMRIAWLAPSGPVKKGDVVVRFDPTEVERLYQDGLSDRDSAERRKGKARVEGDRSEAALDLDRKAAQEELRRAEDVSVTDAEIFSRNEILDGRIDRTLLRKRLDTTEAKRVPTKNLASADVVLADIERRKADLLITEASQGLKDLEVSAPHDGILVFPMQWRGEAVAVGDTVWPSQQVAELPELQTLEARVFVLEGDGGGLAQGLFARVEIEGQPGAAFAGKISRVDALAKNQTRESPVKYFETTIGFDSKPSRSLKPGQRVKATIIVSDLTDALCIPRGALFEKDGRRFVYRMEGGRFQDVEVVVGRRSLAQVVIEQGLRPGDRLALKDPKPSRPERQRREQQPQLAGPMSAGGGR